MIFAFFNFKKAINSRSSLEWKASSIGLVIYLGKKGVQLVSIGFLYQR